jgi:hypothetical protein
MASLRGVARENYADGGRGWLSLGAVLALLPGVASIPGDRVLFLADLAVAAVVATVLVQAW